MIFRKYILHNTENVNSDNKSNAKMKVEKDIVNIEGEFTKKTK